MLDYIYLNLMTYLDKDCLENIDYCMINVAKLSRVINRILGESKLYYNIDEYKRSDFKYVLDFYLYFIDVLIVLKKFEVYLKNKNTIINEAFSQSKDTIALIERKYSVAVKSTNQQKVFIARDVLSYIDVIKDLT